MMLDKPFQENIKNLFEKKKYQEIILIISKTFQSKKKTSWSFKFIRNL